MKLIENKLSFDEAKELIQEGDVLLFKNKGLIPRFIKVYGEGKYSHVGLASRVHNGSNEDILECIEIREWKGGRGVNLERYVKCLDAHIDVYRSIPHFCSWVFDPATKISHLIQIDFDGHKVTRTFRKLLGIEYGWRRIWWIIKRKIAILRLFNGSNYLEQNTEVDDIIYPICSTAVAYAFKRNGYKLIHNKSFDYTEPNDIARSTRLSYLFTIIP